jgi:hypothetical protein
MEPVFLVINKIEPKYLTDKFEAGGSLKNNFTYSIGGL